MTTKVWAVLMTGASPLKISIIHSLWTSERKAGEASARANARSPKFHHWVEGPFEVHEDLGDYKE